MEGNIALGRKTAYSLGEGGGCGVPWRSGLQAAQNGHIWSTFVAPRLLYGLEAQLLKKRDIGHLEKFQRNV